MTDRLRPLWDFGDLGSTEERLLVQLDAETTDGGRAEVLTQLARVHGLRDDFEAGERFIAQAEAASAGSPGARIRIDLERGRLRRSSGDPEAALPLFESAFAAAVDAGEHFLAADAAHMAALVAGNRVGFIAWTSRGIELAETRAGAAHWRAPLLNNLGWEFFESGDHEAALDAFERALVARLDDPANEEPIAIARYAVGKALRSLGRAEQAVGHLEQAVAWAGAAGAPDGWFHEELAENYAALGRIVEAAEQARRALALLPDADPSFGDDEGRIARLEALAGQ